MLIKYLTIAFMVMSFSACSESGENPKLKLDAELTKMPEKLPEGSGSRLAPAAQPANESAETQMAEDSAEGSFGGDNKNHPEVQAQEKIERQVVVPANVEGKWRAVKILVVHKGDEEKTEVKTINLGSSFQIKNTGITVNVGEFFPNFVMNGSSYTSMNNQVINPAIQLHVEENGKTLYKGWTFAKYPDLYSFQHDIYKLELLDFIPANVS